MIDKRSRSNYHKKSKNTPFKNLLFGEKEL